MRITNKSVFLMFLINFCFFSFLFLSLGNKHYNLNFFHKKVIKIQTWKNFYSNILNKSFVFFIFNENYWLDWNLFQVINNYPFFKNKKVVYLKEKKYMQIQCQLDLDKYPTFLKKLFFYKVNDIKNIYIVFDIFFLQNKDKVVVKNIYLVVERENKKFLIKKIKKIKNIKMLFYDLKYKKMLNMLIINYFKEI